MRWPEATVRSLIFEVVVRLFQPLMLLFSLFLLFTGHDRPGGGFSGGLIAASAFVMHFLALGVRSARASLRLDPLRLAGAGLTIALAIAIWPALLGEPLLTALWFVVSLPLLGSLDIGTPLLFDLGVYLLVIGATLQIMFVFGEP